VTFVGPDTDDGVLEKEVLAKVYQAAGIPTDNLPDGVMIDWRDGFWVGVNYSGNTYNVPLSPKANVIIGSKALKTAGVIVWKE
jgi:beta-galactosidase